MNFCLLLTVLVKILVQIWVKIYSQKIFDHTKYSATDALETASKRATQKTPEATGDLIGNKNADKIIRLPKTSPKNNSKTNEEEILGEKYISPQLRKKLLVI